MSETATRVMMTNPQTGMGVAVSIVNDDEDGAYVVSDRQVGFLYRVTAGDLYRVDESGRYLGSLQDEAESDAIARQAAWYAANVEREY